MCPALAGPPATACGSAKSSSSGESISTGPRCCGHGARVLCDKVRNVKRLADALAASQFGGHFNRGQRGADQIDPRRGADAAAGPDAGAFETSDAVFAADFAAQARTALDAVAGPASVYCPTTT